MLKNEKQYKIAKAKLDKWLKNQEIVSVPQPTVPEWILGEQKFAIDEEVRHLQAEIRKYEDLVNSGIQALPDPSIVDDIPTLLIQWRIARGFTQKELAALAGIHENLLQKYESENYDCASYRTIAHIAHVLKNEKELNRACCAR